MADIPVGGPATGAAAGALAQGAPEPGAPAQGAPALQVSGLCKSYPKFSLTDVSFTVEPGSIMGFIGRNGAGKTTTIKSVLGLVHPDAGQVSFFGQPFVGNERAIKQRIGYASGGNAFYGRKRVREIMAMTSTFYENWDADESQRYLRAFSIDPEKKVRELSEGMKVKFGLALALSHHAELLLLDEPTSGVDPVSRDELLEVFEFLADRGVAVFFSTHITSDLQKCADTITYLKEGAVVASKGLDDFMADYPDCDTLEDVMVKLERRPFSLDDPASDLLGSASGQSASGQPASAPQASARKERRARR